MLCIVGPPGIGKTALASHFATQTPSRWYSFADARDEEALCDAISHGGEPANRVERAAEALAAARGGLVVLDNCEQATDAVARCVSAWLELAPDISFLLTSRERIGLSREEVHEVGPLSLPHGSTTRCEAIELWCSAATAASSTYRLEDDDIDTVSEILHRLDGIPLAIELAAAQRRLLASATLLARLDKGLELRSTRRDVPRRHRTLRQAVMWSIELLSTAEQAALSALSVLIGDFGVAAAEAVLPADSPAGVVLALRDKSMLQCLHVGDEVRLSMLGSIRDAAREALGDPSESRRRHAAHYEQVASELSVSFRQLQPSSLHRLSRETGNLFEAARYALDDDVGRALRILLAIHPIVRIHGPYEAYLHLLDAAISNGQGQPLLAASLCARGEVRRVLEHDAQALRDLADAASLATKADDHKLLTRVLSQLGKARFQRRELSLAERHFEELAEIGRERGLRHEEAVGLGGLGLVAQVRGDMPRALDLHSSALAIHRRLDSELYAAIELCNLGVVRLEASDHEQARHDIEEGLSILREFNVPSLCGHAIGVLGLLAHDLEDTDQALEYYDQAIALFEECREVGNGATFMVFRAALLIDTEPSVTREMLERATRKLRGQGHESYLALGTALLATAEARRGRLRQAAELYDAATRLALNATGLGLADTVQLEAAHLHIARGLGEEPSSPAAAGHLESAEAAAADAALAERRSPSAMLRISLRRARDAIALNRPLLSAETIAIGGDGAWFSRHGRRVDLRNRPVLQRALACLAEQRLACPGEPLAADALIRVVWPGERMLKRSAANRLHVTVTRLRKLGLGAALLGGRSGGYMLDRAIPVRRVDEAHRSSERDST